MVTKREFRDFCTDGKYDNKDLEEWQGQLICTIESGQSVTEIIYDGRSHSNDTITHSSAEVEIDASDARIYRNSITTKQSATEVTGGLNLLINEDYEHLL